METVIFIITILGFIIAYLTFKKDHIDEPKGKAYTLSTKYQFAERSTKELIEELEGYATVNNVMDEHFMQGLTFGQGITFLKTANIKLFSEDISKDLIRFPQLATNDLLISIEAHIKHIQEIRTYFKFYVKKDFIA